MANINRLPDSALVADEKIARYTGRLVIDKEGAIFQVRHINRDGADLIPLNGDDGTLSMRRHVELDELGSGYGLYHDPGSIDKSSVSIPHILRQRFEQSISVPSQIGGVPVRETAEKFARRVNRDARLAGQSPEETDL